MVDFSQYLNQAQTPAPAVDPAPAQTPPPTAGALPFSLDSDSAKQSAAESGGTPLLIPKGPGTAVLHLTKFIWFISKKPGGKVGFHATFKVAASNIPGVVQGQEYLHMMHVKTRDDGDGTGIKNKLKAIAIQGARQISAAAFGLQYSTDMNVDEYTNKLVTASHAEQLAPANLHIMAVASQGSAKGNGEYWTDLHFSPIPAQQ